MKKFFFTLLSLVIILILIGFLLPQHQHVERSLVISAPAETVYRNIDNPEAFNRWSPWAELDPAMKIEHVGPESGVGSGMRWHSENPNVGNGSWIITAAKPNESLDVALTFDNGGATSFFHLEPTDQGTRITWGFDTDAGLNPIMRWFGIMMDKWVGTEYEKGLRTLKSRLET